MTHFDALIIGGGPAGLIAAEQLSQRGGRVAVVEQKPTVGRKFLRAGIGGLNITHSENSAKFISRYGDSQPRLAPLLETFDSDALIQWCSELGIETFTGSSGRVFPQQMKAAPLLRRWLKRLREAGVEFYVRHRWIGWGEDGAMQFQHGDRVVSLSAPVTILALGGGSWSALGSDGNWRELLLDKGIACNPFLPSNCGFNSTWPSAFRDALAGQPLKNIGLQLSNGWYRRGDALASDYGVEGSLIYAASRDIRDTIARDGHCLIHWDLLPDTSIEDIRRVLQQRRRGDTASKILQKLGVKESKLTLLKALTDKATMQNLELLPDLLKHLPQTLDSPRPLDEAISTAGGVSFDALDEHLMLKALPGVFCAGEMLDWDAPTGGYLLTASFATGVVAGRGAHAFLGKRRS